MKITSLLPLFFIIFMGFSKAQDSTVVDCSHVLLFTEESQTLLSDTILSIDSLMADIDDYGIMLTVEITGSTTIDKVHVNLGTSVGDDSLLSSVYDENSNIIGESLIYEPYANNINIKLGEFSLESDLYYSITTEDSQGNLSAVYNGSISK